VLVVLLPKPGDRQIAAEQGWYRIRPGRSVTQLGDLARFTELLFYQPDAFGPEGRMIEFRAHVSGYGKVRRIDLLPDEPEHPRAERLYHCFRLGALEPLGRPIRSRIGRRMLFVPTTRARVAGATDINDLFAGTPIEEVLYGRLREHGLRPERELWLDVTVPGARCTRDARHCLDMALSCCRGKLDVECDGDRWHTGAAKAAKDRRRDNTLTARGWHILRFGTADICKSIYDTVACVRDAVAEYGGESPDPVFE
jgi:very-short-patch-repair endonuclease